jgi:predicted nucleic acid-binding protein
MIFVLDTNVLSEAMKPAPSSAVASWLRKQPLRSLFTAAICQAEVLAGIAVLPAGRRRAELEALATGVFNEDFHERVLPFDGRAAAVYAQLFAGRRQMGRPIATADLIVAATAHVHDAAVVTRDAGGFEGCGLTVIDPWTAS